MTSPKLSVVVIGRNEGKRLLQCLQSVRAMEGVGSDTKIVYVDSGSTDGSMEVATSFGTKVISIEDDHPTAAKARNRGWKSTQSEYVLFLDGDTIVHPQFVVRALPQFQDDVVAIVWGNRSEENVQASIYHKVFDLDWHSPYGESAYCGGDALVRRKALEAVDGYDASLIAGEEPDMCRRMRQVGWKVMHVNLPMTSHDLAMTSFRHYWRRNVRTGYAYAQISDRYRHTDDPLWLKEYRSNWIKGLLFMLLGIWAIIALFTGSILVLFIFIALTAILILRTAFKVNDRDVSVGTKLLYGLHSHLAKVPILVGQLTFLWDRLFQRDRKIIEYKK